MVLTTTTRVAVGDELTVSYGNLESDDFLLNYGFLQEDNPADRVSVQFGPEMVAVAKSLVGLTGMADTAQTGPAAEPFQKEALSALGLDTNPEVELGGPTNFGLDGRLYAGLRVLCADSAAELAGKDVRQLQTADAGISASNEAKSRQTARGIAAIVLAQFPTTLADDTALLTAGGLEPDMEMAVRFRVAKKQTLKAIIDGLSRP